MCEQAFSDRRLISEIDLRDFGPLAWDWCGTVFSFDIVLDSSEMLPSLQGGKAGVCLSRQQSKAAEARGGLMCLPYGISLQYFILIKCCLFPQTPLCRICCSWSFLGPAPNNIYLPLISRVFWEVQGSPKLEEYSGNWLDDSVGSAHTHNRGKQS